MAGNEMKCVFCKGKDEKIINFVEDKLKKCREILNIRVKFNLKYNNIELPDNINTTSTTTDGYHKQCYSNFTALMAKYRNLSDSNFTSITDLPSTTHATPSLSNSLVNVSETTPYDAAPRSNCDVNIQENDFCNNVPKTKNEDIIETSSNDKSVCFFCGKDRKGKKLKGKQRSLHSSNDPKLYENIIEWMTRLENDKLLQKINRLESANGTIFYHDLCKLQYLYDYNKIVADTPHTSWHNNRNIYSSIFNNVVLIIEEEVLKKKCYLLLSSLCDTYNNYLAHELKLQPQSDISLMTNHYLEGKILKYFKHSIKILGKHKRKIVMHKDCSLLEDDDLAKLEENDLIDKVALTLRNTILEIDKSILSSTTETNDLNNGKCAIPEKLLRFFKVLIEGKDIRRRVRLDSNTLSYSMASDAIVCVGHCSDYNALETLVTEATFSSVQCSQISLPDIIRSPSLYNDSHDELNVKIEDSDDMLLPPTKRSRTIDSCCD